MKLIGKSIGVLLLLLPLILAVLLILCVEDKPLLRHRADMTPERIAQGKRVFDRNDPRRLRSGTVTRVRLAEQDLDLAVNYAANQMLDAVAGLIIEKDRALISVTAKLPDNPLGKYLNLKIELKQSHTIPRIDHLSVGKLWIPGFLAELLLKAAFMSVAPVGDWDSMVSAVKHVKFGYKQMTLTYQWRDDLPGKLSAALWSEFDQERLKVYQTQLAKLTRGDRRRLELTGLTKPLFQLASQRSRHGDAIAENRALILALAFYVNQKNLGKLMPAAKEWPQPAWRVVTLNGRSDLTKHYLVSAMLAAYAGTPLADAVGLYKEIEDARGGSGFSFNDIAADRAGRQMGELAVSSDNQARRVQGLLAMAKESDFMPETADLPEFMQEAEFQRRFGGLQGEKYRQMMAEIDSRIAALSIYRYKLRRPE